MSIITEVVWADGTPSMDAKRIFDAKIKILKSQNLTDGNYTQTPVDEGFMISRSWATIEAADDWITLALEYNPVSANVVSE